MVIPMQVFWVIWESICRYTDCLGLDSLCIHGKLQIRGRIPQQLGSNFLFPGGDPRIIVCGACGIVLMGQYQIFPFLVEMQKFTLHFKIKEPHAIANFRGQMI